MASWRELIAVTVDIIGLPLANFSHPDARGDSGANQDTESPDSGGYRG